MSDSETSVGLRAVDGILLRPLGQGIQAERISTRSKRSTVNSERDRQRQQTAGGISAPTMKPSPHSGRMIIAQEFTAGMQSGRIVVREADG